MNNMLPLLTPLPNLTYLNIMLLLAEVIKQNINKFDRQMGPLFGLHRFPGSYGQNQFILLFLQESKPSSSNLIMTSKMITAQPQPLQCLKTTLWPHARHGI